MKAAGRFGVSLLVLAMLAGASAAQPKDETADGKAGSAGSEDARLLVPYGAGYEARFGKSRNSSGSGEGGGGSGGGGGNGGNGGGGNGGGNGR